jgi:hypothetical protein
MDHEFFVQRYHMPEESFDKLVDLLETLIGTFAVNGQELIIKRRNRRQTRRSRHLCHQGRKLNLKIQLDSGKAQSTPQPSLFVEQPPDQTGETNQYQPHMKMDPKW